MLSNDDMDLNQADNLSDNMAVKGREISPFENAEYDYYCHIASDVPNVVTQYAGSQSRNAAARHTYIS